LRHSGGKRNCPRASYDPKSLGEKGKDYVTIARVVSRFDVVAAREIAIEGGVEKLVGPDGKFDHMFVG
jgi:hypothetical protein